MKRCSKCKREKPRDQFHTNHHSKDGLRYKCKECIKSYDKEYKGEHKKDALTFEKLYNKKPTERELMSYISNKRVSFNFSEWLQESRLRKEDK